MESVWRYLSNLYYLLLRLLFYIKPTKNLFAFFLQLIRKFTDSIFLPAADAFCFGSTMLP